MLLPPSANPVAVMMGTATIIIPQLLQTYFIRNCSIMMYHKRLDRMRFI